MGSLPSGVPIQVDGTTITTATSYLWQPGTLHSLAAGDYQQNAKTRYVFTRWSQGGPAAQTYTAPLFDTALTAYYSKQYRVAVSPVGGGALRVTPQMADGYYAEGSYLQLAAIPTSGYCFSSWSGLLPGTAANTALTISKDLDIQAIFQVGAITLLPSSLQLGAGGQTVTLAVRATRGCSWSVESEANWIGTTYRSYAGGSSGTVFLTLAPNPNPYPRTGLVRIGEQTAAITQAGRP